MQILNVMLVTFILTELKMRKFLSDGLLGILDKVACFLEVKKNQVNPYPGNSTFNLCHLKNVEPYYSTIALGLSELIRHYSE